MATTPPVILSICLALFVLSPETICIDDIPTPCEDRFSDEARLGCDLLKDYQPEVRPPLKGREKTKVYFGMTLIQIIGIKEKDEELTTTLYMEYQWQDNRLSWNKSDYGGVSALRLPYGSIWIPNIILENSKDENMEAGALKVNAIANHDGSIKWLPPSIYKTSCIIDVTLFPFDWQNCSLVFRSAALDQSQMVFELASDYGNQIVVDKNAFVPNGEWDLIQRPVKIYKQPHDSQFQKIVFYIIVKRKPQFYVLNMLLPCVVLSVLSCFTFYLPIVAAEKISLSISLLLGDTIFAFLFIQRLPSTSLAVPFAASYLLFSMVLLVFCIICCIIVANLHYRSPTTHKMPAWLRFFFFKRLGPLLGIEQPNSKWLFSSKNPKVARKLKTNIFSQIRGETSLGVVNKTPSQVMFKEQAEKFGFQSHRFDKNLEGFNSSSNFTEIPTAVKTAPKTLKPIIESSNFIARHVHKKQDNEMIMDDWAYMAMVLDRLFMWIYLFTFVLGTVGYYFSVETYQYPRRD